MSNKTAIALRDKVKEIRVKPIPISDLIPLLLKAADELDYHYKRSVDLSWIENPDRMGR